MKIFLTGGTGFVGRNLARFLVGQGYQVTVLTRQLSPEKSRGAVSYLVGNPAEKGDWQAEVARHDIVVNLAGASIFSRWTKKHKAILRASRIRTTENIVEALSVNKNRQTSVLLNGSAVGYYGFCNDEVLDESAKPGHDFLAMLSRDWEECARKAEKLSVRVVLCRFGIVLGEEGGALSRMVPLFRLGLGSPLGSGKQWFPWIHIEDLLNIFLFFIKNSAISGPINCCTPNPVTNRELSIALGRALQKPVFMPNVPGFLLRWVMGEMSGVLLNGQRVMPAQLSASGFTYRFENISEALADLV